jgi:holin-like protein
MEALRGFAMLLLLQACGEGLSRLFSLPIPGPVIGLLLLWPVAQWTTLRHSVAAASQLLLSHLSLFFVPAGVGVIAHLDLVSAYGVRLLAVIVLSTWIGLAITALVLRALLDRSAPREQGHE